MQRCFTWSTYWRHQMETFSALLAICAGNSPVTGEFPTPRPVTRALMFSLISAWINGWVNNGEAGDLRRRRAHYDVTVMSREWEVFFKITKKADGQENGTQYPSTKREWGKLCRIKSNISICAVFTWYRQMKTIEMPFCNIKIIIHLMGHRTI